MTPINTCPDCGGSPAVVPDAPEMHYLHARCMNCKLSGPVAETYTQAIALWNHMIAIRYLGG